MNRRITMKKRKDEEIILRGIGASPGVTLGFARICHTPSEIPQKFQGNDVLVVATTDPEWTASMKKAKGIVTNSGGILCHAAIVAREFEIPCVVGTRKATEVLKDGMKIKIDGLKGVVCKIEE